MNAEVERLLARAAVQDVIATIARALDRLDFELLTSCYHPDASDERHGRAIGEFLKWVKPILRSMESTMHSLTTQTIEIDGEVARAETYCVARHRAPAPDAGGSIEWFAYVRYVDRLERRDGSWRVLSRRCAYEPGTLDPTTQQPLAAERLGGSRDRDDPSYA